MSNVAILGYGVVGKGVKQLIDGLDPKLNVKVVKVLDLPIKKEELKELLVSDYTLISEDDSISIVLEALGGDELPYKAITACLKKGKSVITSNKETVSKHLDEYLSLAKENNCRFLFEASVGGGIPLLCNIIQLAKYDKLTSFLGILNGTSNYILTRIFKDGMSFDAALKEAQEKGYAERDPSADLNGTDLLRKGVILSSLAFHKKVDYTQVRHFGIEKVNDSIVKYVNDMNKVLKLVVSGKYEKDKLNLIVTPVLIDRSHELANVNYAFNNVLVDCENNGTLAFYGRGAGSIPTASAMIQDLTRVLNDECHICRCKATSIDVTFDASEDYLVVKDNDFKIVKVNSVDELEKYDFIAKVL